MGKILIIKNADFSSASVETVQILAEAPKISISSEGSVTITRTDASAIYYTTDGSVPTTDSNVYSTAFTVNHGTTVKAFAIVNGVETGVGVETFTDEIVITEFDTSLVENVKYAAKQNDGLFYYSSSQASSAISQISYIIPYKLKAGSVVTIVFKDGAKKNGDNVYGAIHDFSNIPDNLLPTSLLDADYHSYANMKTQTITFTVSDAYQYVELYLFTFTGDTYSPSDIASSIKSITIHVAD